MVNSRRPRARKRPGSKNVFTTKSGHVIKLNRGFWDRFKAHRDDRARRRAAYLSTLPKNPLKRFLYRLHPKRLAEYWFSRDGLIMGLKLTGVGLAACFLLIVGLFAYFRKDLPNINDISGSSLPGSINFYDRTGKNLLYQDYDSFKRVQVEGDKISDNMRDATIAIEDKDFYKHGAFDPRAILRAGFNDVFNKSGGRQGGSTISQQLVKLNQEWTSDRSYTRKIKELILAVELEREYSKDDILNGYLNAAPYGPIEFGVQTAAQEYFGVDAKDLTVAQAAMLAAIPKSPNVYSPYGIYFSSEDLLGRQRYIINQMLDQGLITEKVAKEAKAFDILASVKPQAPSKYAGIRAPWFIQAAKAELVTRLGAPTVKRGGWKVVTTLNLDLQGVAEKAVADNLPNALRITGDAANEAATVAEDVKTGQIVALVGGTDFADKDHGYNNYAANILIPPGSSFKPYDYAAFIENNNAGAGSVLYDNKGALPGYPCGADEPLTTTNSCFRDYDWKTTPFPGPITLRYALGGSRNVPAIKAMLLTLPNDNSADKVPSINKTISTATAMMSNPNIKDGFKNYAYNCYSDEKLEHPTDCYGAAAIGDGAFLHLTDHVNGLATLGRLGQAIPRTFILEITNSNDKLLYKWEQPVAKQAIRPDTAYIVNDMAADPLASYLPGRCTEDSCTPLSSFGYKFHRFNGWHFAIKTGTTNNGFDGLMTSWSSHYAVVSWVGNHKRNIDLSAARRASMETLTEPITRPIMEAAHANIKADNWKRPSGVKTLPAFVITNKVSRLYESVPSPATDLFPSWYTPPKNGSTSQTIDIVSNKVATTCTPDLAKKSQGGANANIFSVDTFVTGPSGSGAKTETDDVHNCNDTLPVVTLSGPAECQDETDCIFTATYTQGTHPINSDKFLGTINFYVNGKKEDSQNVIDSFGTVNFTYQPAAAGEATVKVEIIDSVLYSGSDQGTATFIEPPAEEPEIPPPEALLPSLPRKPHHNSGSV